MGRYILKRLLWMIPVIIGIAILIFSIMYICPGDPAAAILGNGATQVQIEAKRAEMGLNDPYVVRLLRYLKQTFIDFDLGDSYFYGTPVIQGLMDRMPHTLVIACICMLLQIAIGTPLGIVAATHRNGLADRICMFVALLGVSIPGFWLALMMVVLFAVNLGWLPAYGIGGIQYYIMPCIANCFAGIATQARQTRSSMLEVIRSDYVTTARAKGLSESTILFKHILPNSISPVIVSFTMGVGNTIMQAASLSYIGLGVQPPTPEWGAMLSAGKGVITKYPHVCLFPGLCIMVVVLAFNMLGDGLRDAMDPKLKN